MPKLCRIIVCYFFLFTVDWLSDVSDASQQENILEQFPEPYDGDSSSINDSSEDNTSEDEVEEHGFYEYSGMEAMMETGRSIYFFYIYKTTSTN